MDRERLAGKLADKILGVQNRFALFMNRKTAGFSSFKMKLLFSVVCLVYTAIAAFVVFNAITGKPERLPVSHMRKTIPVKKETVVPVAIPVDVLQRLQHFSYYMDSLRLTAEGRFIYDSILREHPGITDSIRQLESIYQLPKK